MLDRGKGRGLELYEERKDAVNKTPAPAAELGVEACRSPEIVVEAGQEGGAGRWRALAGREGGVGRWILGWRRGGRVTPATGFWGAGTPAAGAGGGDGRDGRRRRSLGGRD